MGGLRAGHLRGRGRHLRSLAPRQRCPLRPRGAAPGRRVCAGALSTLRAFPQECPAWAKLTGLWQERLARVCNQLGRRPSNTLSPSFFFFFLHP